VKLPATAHRPDGQRIVSVDRDGGAVRQLRSANDLTKLAGCGRGSGDGSNCSRRSSASTPAGARLARAAPGRRTVRTPNRFDPRRHRVFAAEVVKRYRRYVFAETADQAERFAEDRTTTASASAHRKGPRTNEGRG
jgi:hypothetical protein